MNDVYIQIPKENNDLNQPLISSNYLASSNNLEFTCKICYQNFSKAIASKIIKKIEPCNHNFCLDCLVIYIQTKATEGLPKINCPGEQCGTVFEENFIHTLLSDDEKKKQEEIKQLKELEKNPNIIFCDCGKWGEKMNNEKRIKCNGCQNELCTTCKTKWHEKISCKENQEKQKLLKDIDGVLTKQCPKCLMAINFTYGCNHMTCKCSQEFCWVCEKEWISQGKHMRCRMPMQIRMNIADCIFGMLYLFFLISWLVFGILFQIYMYKPEYYGKEKCTDATYFWLDIASLNNLFGSIGLLIVFPALIFTACGERLLENHRFEAFFVIFIIIIPFFVFHISFWGICAQQIYHKNCDALSTLMLAYLITLGCEFCAIMGAGSWRRPENNNN